MLWRSHVDKHVSDWSADGRLLLVTVDDPKTQRDIWAVPLAGGNPFPLVQGMGQETQPQFSSDGKWIAYTSQESGRPEIYVKGIPNGRAIRISAEGGRVPTWRADGKELLFSTDGGDVMAAAMRTNGTTVEAGVPTKLFSLADIQQAPRFMPDGNILVGEQQTKTVQLLNVSTAWRSRAP
jgi:Periplasmic component of the Tol biopolymer transport system